MSTTTTERVDELAEAEQAIVTEIAMACRILAAHGCSPGIGGHVSVRAPGQDAFFINSFHLTFDEVTPSDVMKLGFDGSARHGRHRVSPGWEFHAGIYQQRADVDAVVHTHGFWVTALSSLNRPLKMRHNLCTFYFEKMAVSPDDTFEKIGPALADANSILIPFHGAVTVDRSLARAVALMLNLEDMAHLDVTLEPTHAPPMPDERCPALRTLVDEVAGYLELTWELHRRKALVPW